MIDSADFFSTNAAFSGRGEVMMENLKALAISPSFVHLGKVRPVPFR